MSEIKSIENISFEEALNELEMIVKKIDSGEEELEKAINNFERGVKLKNWCEKKLQDAKLRIDKIVQNEVGEVTLEQINS